MLSNLHSVFGHFQNLNLLALREDLRTGRTVRQAWVSGSLLCPIAHGMPEREQVLQLGAMGETVDLHQGCSYAARQLSAEPDDVLEFVRCWDARVLSSDALLRMLEEIWQERLADAEAVQELLEESSYASSGNARCEAECSARI